LKLKLKKPSIKLKSKMKLKTNKLTNIETQTPTSILQEESHIHEEKVEKEVKDNSSIFDDLNNAIEISNEEKTFVERNATDSPTMDDVENFVFDEQIEISEDDYIAELKENLAKLKKSTGDQVPKALAKCLLFIKENDFLSKNLKPDDLFTLVTGLRNSHKFMVRVKAKTVKKKVEKANKTQKALNTLKGLGGFKL